MENTDYKKIFDTYYKPLVHFVISRISQRDIAEDIVQEVFISIWDKNIICENELVLRSYLYNSVSNHCKNYLREQQIHYKHNKFLQQEIKEFDNEVLNTVISQELYRQLLTALDNLPPQCRKIYEMSQDGMKLSEIANELSLSIETIKKQRKIAKKILLHNIGKHLLVN